MENTKSWLNVNNGISINIAHWHVVIVVISWLMLIGGIITTIIGLGGEDTVLIIGIALIVYSIMSFILSAFFKGFKVLVEVAEYKKAKMENDYIIKKI